MKYKATTLDVWGNQEDGYEINNFFNYQTIDGEDLENFKAFCEEHLMGDPEQYEIDDCSTESFYEIRVKDTGYPVLHLQAIYEGEADSDNSELSDGSKPLTPFFNNQGGVKPLDHEALYLDFVNNFLTIDRFAEHHGFTGAEARKIVSIGGKLNRSSRGVK